MLDADNIRALALGFEGVIEQDHHGAPSFRVSGKIFCTMRASPVRLMVKLGPEDQHNLCEAHPDLLAPVPGYWGRKGATFVGCEMLDRELALMLLRLAWSRVTPTKNRKSR